MTPRAHSFFVLSRCHFRGPISSQMRDNKRLHNMFRTKLQRNLFGIQFKALVDNAFLSHHHHHHKSFFFSPPSRFFHSTHRWSACWASAYSRSPLKSWMKWCVALWVVEKKSHNSRPDTEIESVFCPLACFFFFSYTERDHWVLSTV